MDKKQLRKACRRSRREIEGKEEKSAKILERILALPEMRGANVIGLYMAMEGEPDLSGLFDRCPDRILAIPKVTGESSMSFYRVESPRELSRGAYGILEPGGVSERKVPPQALDLILVPGVAFEEAGGRIGSGKGYYDRYLKQAHALRVGVAFDQMILPKGSFSPEKTDIPMDVLVSESRTVRPDSAIVF